MHLVRRELRDNLTWESSRAEERSKFKSVKDKVACSSLRGVPNPSGNGTKVVVRDQTMCSEADVAVAALTHCTSSKTKKPEDKENEDRKRRGTVV